MSNKNALLIINDLHAKIGDKTILKGVSLEINPGSVHALMGRNGSGKSTLSYTIMGHPKYEVSQGDIKFEGNSLLNLSPDERAKLGIALSFQYPVAIPGVTVLNFLKTSLKAVLKRDIPIKELRPMLKAKMQELEIKDEFLSRYVNDGFSGGEKKKLEILHLSLLKPKLAILDETDSGLDIDALKVVANGITSLNKEGTAILLITHYQRILNYVTPQFVHIFENGEITNTGNHELAFKLEEFGYEYFAKANPLASTNSTKEVNYVS